jgi:hypothetical protein
MASVADAGRLLQQARTPKAIAADTPMIAVTITATPMAAPTIVANGMLEDVCEGAPCSGAVMLGDDIEGAFEEPACDGAVMLMDVCEEGVREETACDCTVDQVFELVAVTEGVCDGVGVMQMAPGPPALL